MSFTSNTTTQLARAVANYRVIIVPGLRNSDSEHWQSRWQAQLPTSERISVADWSVPNLENWREGIKQLLDSADEPVIIIAHSFGTLAAASLVTQYADKIIALFLVAPADPDKFSIADKLPTSELPVTTKIIASSNDPWMQDSKALAWALRWGADFLRLKNVGHINSESNLGDWPQGITELQRLIESAKRNRCYGVKTMNKFRAA